MKRFGKNLFLRGTTFFVFALLFSWATQALHFALIDHTWCESHHEFTHHEEENHEHHTDRVHSNSSAIQQSFSSHPHEHCSFTFLLSQKFQISHFQSSLDCPTYNPSDLPFILSSQSKSYTKLILISPKTSPPFALVLA